MTDRIIAVASTGETLDRAIGATFPGRSLRSAEIRVSFAVFTSDRFQDWLQNDVFSRFVSDDLPRCTIVIE